MNVCEDCPVLAMFVVETCGDLWRLVAFGDQFIWDAEGLCRCPLTQVQKLRRKLDKFNTGPKYMSGSAFVTFKDFGFDLFHGQAEPLDLYTGKLAFVAT